MQPFAPRTVATCSSCDCARRFDGMRNFSTMRVHANNLFHRDVRVFAGATVFGSALSQDSFEDSPDSEGSLEGWRRAAAAALVRYEYRRDSVSESARSVSVPLRHLVARQLTVRLEFDARWIMISEIQFDSGQSYIVLCIQRIYNQSI